MKPTAMIITTCIVGILVMAAGCTGTSDNVPITVAPGFAATPWNGTWDTGASTPAAYQTVGVLTMSQTGSSVSGTFTNQDQGKGTITGSVTGNVLTGTWTMTYPRGSDSGSFRFVLSDDDSTSFTGTWVSANDKTTTLSTTEDFWNGTRR